MKKFKNDSNNWLYWFSLGVSILIANKFISGFNNISSGIMKIFSILSPFLGGILLAYLLYMPCAKIERMLRKFKGKIFKKRARKISVFIVYFISVVLIMLAINIIIPVIIESVTDLINNTQGYIEVAIDRYNNLPEDSILKGENVHEIVKNIQNVDIKKYINMDKILGYVSGALGAVTSVFDIFVTIVVSIYILIERDEILNFFKRFIHAICKETTYRNIDKYFANSNEIFFKFIVSQFLDAVIVGILVTIAMSIMKVKYAPLLGFTIGLFNMIPYIGAIIAVALAAIITLITGGLSQSIWMLIVVIILQQIDANVINPKIVGQSLKISPLLVIFAITVGGSYFGMIGMFLAVPVAAVIKIIISDYIKIRLENKREIEE